MFLEVLRALFRCLFHVVARIIVTAGFGFRIRNLLLNCAQGALVADLAIPIVEQGFNQDIPPVHRMPPFCRAMPPRLPPDSVESNGKSRLASSGGLATRDAPRRAVDWPGPANERRRSFDRTIDAEYRVIPQLIFAPTLGR